MGLVVQQLTGFASLRHLCIGLTACFLVAAGGPLATAALADPASTPPVLLPRHDLSGLSNFAQIAPGLYRSAQPEATGFATLKTLGIKTVCNLRAFHSDAKMIAGTGLDYVNISFKIWHPEDEDVVAFLKLVTDPKRQPVLVHCQHGADRTGMMCAIYRMVIQGWTKDQALAELPRFGFHSIWSHIINFLRDFDVEKYRDQFAPKQASH